MTKVLFLLLLGLAPSSSWAGARGVGQCCYASGCYSGQACFSSLSGCQGFNYACPAGGAFFMSCSLDASCGSDTGFSISVPPTVPPPGGGAPGSATGGGPLTQIPSGQYGFGNVNIFGGVQGDPFFSVHYTSDLASWNRDVQAGHKAREGFFQTTGISERDPVSTWTEKFRQWMEGQNLTTQVFIPNLQDRPLSPSEEAYYKNYLYNLYGFLTKKKDLAVKGPPVPSPETDPEKLRGDRQRRDQAIRDELKKSIDQGDPEHTYINRFTKYLEATGNDPSVPGRFQLAMEFSKAIIDMTGLPAIERGVLKDILNREYDADLETYAEDTKEIFVGVLFAGLTLWGFQAPKPASPYHAKPASPIKFTSPNPPAADFNPIRTRAPTPALGPLAQVPAALSGLAKPEALKKIPNNLKEAEDMFKIFQNKIMGKHPQQTDVEISNYLRKCIEEFKKSAAPTKAPFPVLKTDPPLSEAQARLNVLETKIRAAGKRLSSAEDDEVRALRDYIKSQTRLPETLNTIREYRSISGKHGTITEVELQGGGKAAKKTLKENVHPEAQRGQFRDTRTLEQAEMELLNDPAARSELRELGLLDSQGNLRVRAAKALDIGMDEKGKEALFLEWVDGVPYSQADDLIAADVKRIENYMKIMKNRKGIDLYDLSSDNILKAKGQDGKVKSFITDVNLEGGQNMNRGSHDLTPEDAMARLREEAVESRVVRDIKNNLNPDRVMWRVDPKTGKTVKIPDVIQDARTWAQDVRKKWAERFLKQKNYTPKQIDELNNILGLEAPAP